MAPLDASEIDRIVETTGVPLAQLLDWKNRAGEPFRLRCEPLPSGLFRCEIDLPAALKVQAAFPLVHGEYEKREEPGGALVYESRPGNTLGQLQAPDGRPAFGIAYDLTMLDDQGRPTLKVYFGSAAAWYVKNEYHGKWNELREIRLELEPQERRPSGGGAPAPKPREEPRGEDRRRGRGRRGRGGRGRGR